MSRYIITSFSVLFVFNSLFAQTLFTYGGDSVSIKEFQEAYTKNNTATNKNPKALQEYLNLYIASRLKIREAKERRYDTLPQLVADLQGLREQVIPSYLNDAESVNQLVNEAFLRSQKDIHLGAIFISSTKRNGQPDSAGARQRANEVYKELKDNANFFDLARKYSDDTTVRKNGGDIGYITVFTLPYAVETIVYNTPIGKVAPIYPSKAGYYIFKNLGERQPFGKVKAAQILLAFPPEADAATKKRLQKLADSLYSRIQKGDDFGKLAKQYSNDFISASSNGMMPDFGVGQYEPRFENTVFSLKNGTISKPFTTSYGYHIVKRISSISVSDKRDANTLQTIRDKVEQDDRINSTKVALAQKVLKQTNFKKGPFSDPELWALTDSLLDNKPITVLSHLQATSPLFTIGDKKIGVEDWINYAQTYRYQSNGSGIKPYSQLWNEFVQATTLDYYKDHLETFNDAFRHQVTEFKEGNLFFEIMQRQIWGPAQSDTEALQNYYQQHREKYQWQKSADAVIFYANNEGSAKQLAEAIKKNPSHWKSLVAAVSDKVTADSGRFEVAQIPGATSANLKRGTVTVPVLNKADQTASFSAILKVYPEPAQRSFADAKGMVINDYQAELEEKWLQELKAKYPIKMNEKALESLLAQK